MLFCAAGMDLLDFFFRIVEGAGPDWLAFFFGFREKQCRFCLISIY